MRLAFAGTPGQKSDNKAAFIKAFKDADEVFPVTGNDHLIQVLAAILLCFRLEEYSEVNNVIALAVRNMNFLGQYQNTISVPVSAYARKHLQGEAKELRELKIDSQQDEIDELVERKNVDDYEFEGADHVVVVDTLDAILHAQKVFSEESNILWWLFGEASFINGQNLKELNLPKAIPFIARELFDLLQFELGTTKIGSIINKAVLNSGNAKSVAKEYSALEIIAKFDTDEISALLSDFDPKTEFTPLLSALNKFVALGRPADLTTPYANEFNGGDLKKTFDSTTLANQMFNEFLLLKNLN